MVRSPHSITMCIDLIEVYSQVKVLTFYYIPLNHLRKARGMDCCWVTRFEDVSNRHQACKATRAPSQC